MTLTVTARYPDALVRLGIRHDLGSFEALVAWESLAEQCAVVGDEEPAAVFCADLSVRAVLNRLVEPGLVARLDGLSGRRIGPARSGGSGPGPRATTRGRPVADDTPHPDRSVSPGPPVGPGREQPRGGCADVAG